MNEEIKAKRDELAKEFANKLFPNMPVEVQKHFTQDLNFARRMSHTSAYQSGFDACFELMQKDNEELKQMRSQDQNSIEAKDYEIVKLKAKLDVAKAALEKIAYDGCSREYCTMITTEALKEIEG